MPISDHSEGNIYMLFGKRFMDFCVALLLLVVGFPFLMVLTVVNAIDLQGNPFFLQARIGKNDGQFTLLKFRTFSRPEDYQSISKWGRFLRASSLDESPQLLNILSGTMSFVGPRPLLPAYLAHYTEEERGRHKVRPGLTGKAQIELGNSADWDQRMKADLDYVRNISLIVDLSILVHTIGMAFNFKEKMVSDSEIERFDDFAKRR